MLRLSKVFWFFFSTKNCLLNELPIGADHGGRV
jgi:hypothetical protein